MTTREPRQKATRPSLWSLGTKERGDHTMSDSRFEVLNVEFTVCAVWDQLEPWHYSETSQIWGIPQNPGVFCTARSAGEIVEL